MILDQEDFNDGYYHFRKDLEEYPEAWCYVVWSRRGPGKTYSELRYSLAENIKQIYMKRTIEDTDLICSSNASFDASPYVPLNRDFGLNIKAQSIKKGVGGFYHMNEEGEPIGAPVSYVLALNAVKKFKGFDFSICDFVVMDEFIPQRTEVVKRGEGEQLLDLYMTVSRDRQKRGRPPLKLILFANAEEISTPITNCLEIVDTMADLAASGKSHYYDKERGILFHHITEEEIPIKDSEKDGIFRAMQNTAWHAKSFGGDFSNNDFSNVKRESLKGYQCLCKVIYKNKDIFIYLNPNNGKYRICSSKCKVDAVFDLRFENDQRRFYILYCVDIMEACTEWRCSFEKFSQYDLISNYSKFFKL